MIHFIDIEIFLISVTVSPRRSWSELELRWITAAVGRKRRTRKKTSTRKLKTNLTPTSGKSRGNPRTLLKTRQRRHNHLRRRNQNSKKPWKPSHGAAAAIWMRVPRSHFTWASARDGRSRWSTKPRLTGTATLPRGSPRSSTSPARTCWATSTAPTTGSCLSSSSTSRWEKLDAVLCWDYIIAPLRWKLQINKQSANQAHYCELTCGWANSNYSLSGIFLMRILSCCCWLHYFHLHLECHFWCAGMRWLQIWCILTYLCICISPTISIPLIPGPNHWRSDIGILKTLGGI